MNDKPTVSWLTDNANNRNDATMHSKPEMNGATTLNNELTVAADKASTLGGTLTVGKSTTLNGALAVAADKATTLGSSLTVGKSTTLNDGLTVAADKATPLGGTLTV